MSFNRQKYRLREGRFVTNDEPKTKIRNYWKIKNSGINVLYPLLRQMIKLFQTVEETASNEAHLYTKHDDASRTFFKCLQSILHFFADYLVQGKELAEILEYIAIDRHIKDEAVS